MKNFDSLDKLNFDDDKEKKENKRDTIIIISSIAVIIVIIITLAIFISPSNRNKSVKRKDTSTNTNDNYTIDEDKDEQEDDNDKDKEKEPEDEQLQIVLDGFEDIVSTEEKTKEEESSGKKTYAFSYPLDKMEVNVEGGTMKATYKGKETTFYLESYQTNTMDEVVANIDILKDKTNKNYNGNLTLDSDYSYKEIESKMWYTANGKLLDQNYSSGYTEFHGGIVAITILTKDMEINEVYKDITNILNNAKIKEE